MSGFVSTDYDLFLDGTIRHLKRLKAMGTRYVAVNTEILNALSTPLPRRRSTSPPPDVPLTGPLVPNTIDRPRAGSGQQAEPSGSDRVSKLASNPQPITPSEPQAKETKEAAMDTLRKEVLACQICPHLARARQQVVFGVGNVHADLMFVGEAPGADEDEQGEPFVGKAGQLLTRIIQAMGLSRDLVYIGNILKCRPDTPGQTSGNRKPTPEEMQTCLPHLIRQIEIIQPKVLVALGATAVEGLLGKTIGITKLRGNFREYRGIPVMPTYHPAYLLRNQSLATKREVWEDMLQVMEKIGLPISEKQRKFFLKS